VVATRRRAPEPRLYELGVEVRPERADEIVAWFVEHGATGLEERPRAQGVEVVLYGESRRVLERLGRAAKEELAVDGPLRITVRAAPAALAAWRSSVAEHLEPCRLTERLIAVPTTRPIPRLARG